MAKRYYRVHGRHHREGTKTVSVKCREEYVDRVSELLRGCGWASVTVKPTSPPPAPAVPS